MYQADVWKGNTAVTRTPVSLIIWGDRVPEKFLSCKSYGSSCRGCTSSSFSMILLPLLAEVPQSVSSLNTREISSGSAAFTFSKIAFCAIWLIIKDF
jgi:hypothetical protein